MNDNKDKQVAFRIDSETLKKIDAMAKQQSRTRSAMIVLLLKKVLTM